MKLESINKNSIRKISKTELISMHYRIHQLYGLKNKKYKYDLKHLHSIIVSEMIRRNIKHDSDLRESLEQNIKYDIIDKYLNNIFGNSLNEID